MFYLALNTGMRQGELLGLMWSDLDWGNGILQVQRQIQRSPGHGLTFVQPKSKASRRAIMLGANAIQKLRDQLDRIESYRSAAGTEWQENGLMFPTTLGSSMHPTSMYKDFKRLLKKLGLPDIRFHDLRHTAATLMLHQGVHPKVVQERLGHADIGITLNVYSHVLPSMQADAAVKMDDILCKPIDVSREIKKVEELKSLYSAWSSNEISNIVR